MPPDTQMQLIGERLLERILPSAPKLANKVVGMFMPMGPEALLGLCVCIMTRHDTAYRQTAPTPGACAATSLRHASVAD